MNRFAKALDEGSMDEDCSEDGDCFEEEDDEMSEEDGPDDSMTIFQYQEEIRRESLICKSVHPVDLSQKKGKDAIRRSWCWSKFFTLLWLIVTPYQGVIYAVIPSISSL